MANDDVALLKQGVTAWNAWRQENPDVRPDLIGAYLTEVNLGGANLHGANLIGAYLTEVNLGGANLHGANLGGANLSEANLTEANLTEAKLREAKLSEANLSRANLSEADLSKADLSEASLVRTRLSATTMTGARIYGASVWDVETNDETKQTGLIITPEDQSAIMVDDLEVAQLIYLLLNREKIRNVINTVTRRGVLLLAVC